MSTKDLIITQKEKVRDAFGKTDKDIAKDVEIIREWFKAQPHLPEIPSAQMIEAFLVINKFSIERTKPKLDMYYTIRALLPDVYQNMTPNSPRMKDISKMVLTCLLPKLTKDLYRVIILKIVGDPEDFSFVDINAYILHLFEVQIQEDINLGYVYVVDYENLNMSHIAKVNPTQVKKIALVLEKVFSNRIKGIHILNYPSYVDLILNIVKVVLKPKLVQRIHLHPKTDGLYEHVSKDVLPSDYGGEERSVQELHDLWALKLEEYSDRFEKLERMKVKEELRPEPLKNDDILGFHGNFKKLDVD